MRMSPPTRRRSGARNMAERSRQLPLDLPVETSLEAEDFLVSPSNEAAYALIERWPEWPHRIVRLIGPEGSGKTHLCAMWARRAHAWTTAGFEVSEPRVPHLVSGGSLVVEDCDRGPLDEHAVFHLVNALHARGGFALMTARAAPERWGLRTPDLLSRLRQSPAVEIGAPDDALLKAVLVKLFLDRQLVVDTSVVDFIALRIERSLAGAREAVARLDREALSRGRRITRGMAAEMIEALQGTS
jgi:chromosomal replication initiation ATPase DnaA